MKANFSNGISGCVYCGSCLYGFPHELIYNSKDTLSEMIAKNEVSYISNIYVTKVIEKGNEVRINAISIDDNEKIVFKCEKVFFAAGVLSITMIYMLKQ